MLLIAQFILHIIIGLDVLSKLQSKNTFIYELFSLKLEIKDIS